MTRFAPLTFLLALAMSTSACGILREAGPLEDERGLVTYWLVTDSIQTFDGCTDADSWRSTIEQPDFPENAYLMYRVSEDGSTAVAQSCTTTLASSCVDSSTGIVFDVSGHELTWDPAPDISDVMGSSCDVEADQLWVVEDEGDFGVMEVSIAINLVGDSTACADLDTSIKNESSNGLGFDGCTISLSVDLAFDQAD